VLLVCCSVLQCVAVCYSCVAVCCSVLQSVTRVLQCVAVCCRVLLVCCSVLQCVAVCCRVSLVCCSVLQCVAECYSCDSWYEKYIREVWYDESLVPRMWLVCNLCAYTRIIYENHIHRKSRLYLPLSSVNLVLKLMVTTDGISTRSGWNRVSRWWCQVSPGIYILSWLKL